MRGEEDSVRRVKKVFAGSSQPVCWGKQPPFIWSFLLTESGLVYRTGESVIASVIDIMLRGSGVQGLNHSKGLRLNAVAGHHEIDILCADNQLAP